MLVSILHAAMLLLASAVAQETSAVVGASSAAESSGEIGIQTDTTQNSITLPQATTPTDVLSFDPSSGVYVPPSTAVPSVTSEGQMSIPEGITPTASAASSAAESSAAESSAAESSGSPASSGPGTPTLSGGRTVTLSPSQTTGAASSLTKGDSTSFGYAVAMWGLSAVFGLAWTLL